METRDFKLKIFSLVLNRMKCLCVFVCVFYGKIEEALQWHSMKEFDYKSIEEMWERKIRIVNSDL